MTCPIPASTAYGISTSASRRLAMDQAPVVIPNPLERLAQLVNASDRLMDELTTSRARIVSARTYLDRPGCNAGFGSAHLERCRARHAGILSGLRANRIEALRLLGDQGSAA